MSEAATTTTKGTGGIPFGELARSHLALLASFVAILTVVVKLVMVTHGNAETIAIIIQSQSSANLALASLATSLTGLAWVGIVWAAPQMGEAIRERDPLLVPVSAFVVTLLLILVLVPWHIAWGFVVYSAWFVASSLLWGARLARWGRTHPRRMHRGWEITITVILGLVIAWFVLVGSDRVWLPIENITSPKGDRVVGYVLSDSGGTLSVLRDADRVVVRIRSDDIASREFCTRNNDDQRTLPAVVLRWSKPEYPRCP